MTLEKPLPSDEPTDLQSIEATKIEYELRQVKDVLSRYDLKILLVLGRIVGQLPRPAEVTDQTVRWESYDNQIRRELREAGSAELSD